VVSARELLVEHDVVDVGRGWSVVQRQDVAEIVLPDPARFEDLGDVRVEMDDRPERRAPGQALDVADVVRVPFALHGRTESRQGPELRVRSVSVLRDESEERVLHRPRRLLLPCHLRPSALPVQTASRGRGGWPTG